MALCLCVLVACVCGEHIWPNAKPDNPRPVKGRPAGSVMLAPRCKLSGLLPMATNMQVLRVPCV